MPEKTGQCLVSPDCVFDASLVPGTCLDRFVDLKGFIQQVPGESFIVPKDGIRRKLPITLFWITSGLPTIRSVAANAEVGSVFGKHHR